MKGKQRRVRFSALLGVTCHGPLISIIHSPLRSKSMAVVRLLDNILRILAFDVLPQVIQITCGGGPRRINKSTKSLSLLMTTAPSRCAASNISSSSASGKPISRRAIASTLSKFSLIQRASAGDSCASIQSFTLLSPDDRFGYGRNEQQPQYPRPVDQASLRE